MPDRISNSQISSVVQSMLKNKKLFDKSDTALIFYDLFLIEQKIKELKRVFPKNAFHAVAVKANPLIENLKFIKQLNVGVEAASFSEIHLALKAGIAAKKIVFDSPAKTEDEISFALRKGIHINADSFQELDIIKKLLKKIKSESKIGVRINPQVGTGKIPETSVAGEYSKFGIPVKEYRNELQKYFLENSWLRGVHLHIGSQGISKNMLIKGAKIVYDFALETNNKLRLNGQAPINQFDIGGGLPVSYYPKEKPVALKEYTNGLKKSCPKLFTHKFRLITEFGRYVYANSGWALSRVEYVKRSGSLKTAVIHLGADMFLRKAYMPDKWHHEIFVLNEKGQIKKGRKAKYVIAGPLCFAGDVLARNILLPEIKAGDYIIIKDIGAYTLSMWSRYNSRQMPKVIGYKFRNKVFSLLKKRESVNKVIEFWS